MPRSIITTIFALSTALTTGVEAQTPDSGMAGDSAWTDAWGQSRNFGLASAELLLSNVLPWAFNEIVPHRAELKISQISPTSWWHNFEKGFSWDDNAFQVNQFAHPYQGNMYFNSARGNGYNYWVGLLFAGTGSLMWECCGETHRMSINDWYNTTLGGAAVGEVFYRWSSMVLDNTARGSERAWREVGAFLLNPTRGFSRLLYGNSSRVYANPEHPSDRIPERLENILSAGVRVVGDGRISDETEVHGFLSMQMIAGSLLSLDRQRPYDYFSVAVQINGRQEDGLGLLRIRGNLWYKTLTDTETANAKLAIVQDFEYENNDAYQFGGQGASLMYIRRNQLGDRTSLEWNAAATFMPMAAVNSEFAILADVAGIRERLREYDFGSGLGTRATVMFARDGYRWLEANYRLQYLNTLNGSNRNGRDADHLLQMLGLRAFIPLGIGRWGVGAEYQLFLRDSYFDFENFGEVHQRVPQWQFFLTWNPNRQPG